MKCVRSIYMETYSLGQGRKIGKSARNARKDFYKWGVSPPGPHKPNTAVAQAYCNAEEIMSYCKEKLAGYKVPGDVVFLDELPKINGWKLIRKELESRYGNA